MPGKSHSSESKGCKEEGRAVGRRAGLRGEGEERAGLQGEGKA
jgi:hypothetical protein